MRHAVAGGCIRVTSHYLGLEFVRDMHRLSSLPAQHAPAEALFEGLAETGKPAAQREEALVAAATRLAEAMVRTKSLMKTEARLSLLLSRLLNTFADALAAEKVVSARFSFDVHFPLSRKLYEGSRKEAHVDLACTGSLAEPADMRHSFAAPFFVGELKGKAMLERLKSDPVTGQVESELVHAFNQHGEEMQAAAGRHGLPADHMLWRPVAVLRASPQALLLELYILANTASAIAIGTSPGTADRADPGFRFLRMPLCALESPFAPAKLSGAGAERARPRSVGFFAAFALLLAKLHALPSGAPLNPGTGIPAMQHQHHLPIKSHTPLRGQLSELVPLSVDSYRHPVVFKARQDGDGAEVIVKTFDYHMRDMDPDARRVPPPKEALLDRLASNESLPRATRAFYARWIVHTFTPDVSVLIYPYQHGEHRPSTWAQLVQLLEVVNAMHAAGYVHGDILPRNVIFGRDGGPVVLIDFDLSRVAGAKYVTNFNHQVGEYRHQDARAGRPMLAEHDRHSLGVLCDELFGQSVATVSQALKDPASSLTDAMAAARGLVTSKAGEPLSEGSAGFPPSTGSPRPKAAVRA
jgi:hypothetical protein